MKLFVTRYLRLWLIAQRWGCSTVGPLFMMCATVWTTQTLTFLHAATKTTGMVVELVPYRGDDAIVEFAPVFQFADDNGAAHVLKSSLRTHPAGFTIGEQVTVFYMPDRPDEARIATFMQLWFFPVVVGATGTAAGLFGTWLWVLHFRKSSRIAVKEVTSEGGRTSSL